MKETIDGVVLVALITIYIVDVSGFTQSWRGALAKALGMNEPALRPLPPFDCGKCATWWATIIYALATGAFSLPIIGMCAMLSLLSVPIGQLMIFIREGLNALVGKLFDIL